MKVVCMRQLALVLVTAAALAAPLGAQPLSLGPEIRAASVPNSYFYDVSIAAGVDGGFLTAWFDWPLPWAAAFGPDDKPRQLWPARMLSGGTGQRTTPRTAPLAAGGYVTVWGIYHEISPINPELRIAGEILDASGSRIVTDLELAEDAFMPAVAGDPAGGFILVWESNGAIVARRFDAQGAPSTGALAVSPDGHLPWISSFPDGGFAVVWVRGDIDGPPFYPIYGKTSVHLRIFRPDGTPAGPEIEIDGGDERSRRNVRVGADARGRIVAAWVEGEKDFSSSRVDNLWQVRVQRFTATGDPLGGLFSVQETREKNRGLFLGDVAMRPDGSFLLLWHEGYLSVGSNGGDRPEFLSDVWFRAFDAGGAPLGPSTLLPDDSAGDQQEGEAEVTADGWLVSWSQHGGSKAGVYARRISAPVCGGSSVLCLNSQRFRAEVVWRVSSTGAEGTGTSIPLTGDTGGFWFFSPSNYELLVKVLDGRGVNGHFWVFYGSLTDVEFDLTITDTATGQQRTYHNPAGTMASRADTEAF
jgi:hypothetical protein